MKKKWLFFMACLFVLASIHAQQLPTSVILEGGDTIVLHLGSDTTLRATVLPLDANDQSVTWEINPASSKIVKLVPSPDQPECIITGKAEGTVRVIVHTKIGNYRDTCVIKVIMPITDMTLNEQSMTLKVDETSALIARIRPLDATISSVEWKSLNPAVVSIITDASPDDTICNIRAVGVGSASIVARTVDGEFTDTCKITVGADPIESFVLSDDTLRFAIQSDTFLTAQVFPALGTDKRVIWKIINEPDSGIFQIEHPGYDTICYIASKDVFGIAKIEAATVDGAKKDTCVIIVHGVPVTGITLSRDSLELNIQDDSVLIASILPNPLVDEDSITWTSSDSSVVDIISVTDQTTCAIKAGFSGEARIYATTFDGGFVSSCLVRVVVPADNIVLNTDTMKIAIDSIAKLQATFYPDTATQDPLTWTVEDPTLLTLASPDNGDTIMQISPLALGTTNVYVETVNGKKDTCLVTILLDSVKIDVMTDTLELSLNKTDTLKTRIYPYPATGYQFEWTSNDSAVVDIVATPGDSVCVIEGLQVGRCATICLIDAGSGYLDSCVVKVVDKQIQKVVLDTLNLNLSKGESYTLKATVSPLDASNDTIKWLVEHENVVDTAFNAEASDTLRITGKYKGTTKIYAVSVSDNTKKDSCLVHVYIPIDSVVFDPQEIHLTVDSIVNLKAVIYPDSALRQPLIWKIRNRTIVDSVSMEDETKGDTIKLFKGQKLGETKIYVSTGDGLRKDTCTLFVDSVHVKKVEVLTSDTISLSVDSVMRVYAAVTPDNATCDSLLWSVSDPTVVSILSKGKDTVCDIRAESVGLATLYAVSVDGGIKDSCVIKAIPNDIMVVVDTTANNNGRIELSLMLTDDASFEGTFKVQFPNGFYVLEDSCEMLNPYNAADTLVVTAESDNTWLFSVQPKVETAQLVLRSGATLKRVLSIAYTVEERLNDDEDVYRVKFKDLDFVLSDKTELKKDLITLPIKSYTNPTANEAIDDVLTTNYAYVSEGDLYVHSAKSETIRVYSVSGVLLAVRQKTEGQATVRLNTSEKILIVTGSSGWTQKVSNQ